jgi:MFS family permease
MAGPFPDPRASGTDDRSYVPRWLRFAPFLGRPPALTRRQWRVLGLVAAASLFDQYDLGLFSLALKQIQAELGIAEHRVGILGAVVIFGAIPASLLALAADRFGRRRLLLLTIVAYTGLTGATAVAPSVEVFIALQFLARTFVTAEIILAIVVVAEEFDAESRGWGIGALSALALCGHGLALALFSLVEVLPFGWRALYAVGLVPLALIAVLRRGLPETAHFERHAAARAAGEPPRGALRPLADLVRVYPGRAAALGAVAFLLAFAERAAAFFAPKYVQEAHGWEPAHYALLGFVGGFFAIFANTLAGRWSDRFGRRRLAVLFLALNPPLVIAFYNGRGAWLPPLWVSMTFCAMAGGVLLRTFATELFPTSHRSTAAGAMALVTTLGAVLGMSAESALYGLLGSHWEAISLLVVVALAGPFIVRFALPETSGRALDEISPEPGGGGERGRERPLR